MSDLPERICQLTVDLPSGILLSFCFRCDWLCDRLPDKVVTSPSVDFLSYITDTKDAFTPRRLAQEVRAAPVHGGKSDDHVCCYLQPRDLVVRGPLLNANDWHGRRNAIDQKY